VHGIGRSGLPSSVARASAAVASPRLERRHRHGSYIRAAPSVAQAAKSSSPELVPEVVGLEPRATRIWRIIRARSSGDDETSPTWPSVTAARDSYELVLLDVEPTARRGSPERRKRLAVYGWGIKRWSWRAALPREPRVLVVGAPQTIRSTHAGQRLRGDERVCAPPAG